LLTDALFGPERLQGICFQGRRPDARADAGRWLTVLWIGWLVSGCDNNTPLMKKALDKDPVAVAAMLQQGVDANVRNSYGWTALMHAARLGDEARVKELAATADELKRLRTEFSQLHETAAAEPNNADVRCRLGVLARALDRPDLARGWFEAALAINPRHHEARRYLAPGDSASDLSGVPPRR
jgi:ankyrin repeat protein